MGIDTLLSKVKATADRRASDLDAEYARLVGVAVAGGEVDPEQVAELLERMGRTAEDFAGAVEFKLRRRELAAKVAERPEVVAKRDAAQKRAEDLVGKLNAATAEYNLKIRAELDEVAKFQDQIVLADAAQSELLRTADSPDLIAREEAIGKRMLELQNRGTSLIRSQSVAVGNARKAREYADKFDADTAEGKNFRAEADGLAARLAEIEADYRANADEQDRLRRERVEIEQAKLEA